MEREGEGEGGEEGGRGGRERREGRASTGELAGIQHYIDQLFHFRMLSFTVKVSSKLTFCRS